jgi:hypothetical protein
MTRPLDPRVRADAPHRSECFLLRSEGQVATVDLPPKRCFVVISPDDTPRVIQTDSGTYEIDAQALGTGQAFPIMIMVVRSSHARAFANMTQHQATDLLKQASSHGDPVPGARP